MWKMLRIIIGVSTGFVVSLLIIATALVASGPIKIDRLLNGTPGELITGLFLFGFMSLWIHIWLSPFIFAFSFAGFLLRRYWRGFNEHCNAVLICSAIALFSGLGGEILMWFDKRPQCPDSINSWFCVQVQYLYDTDPLIMGTAVVMAGFLVGLTYGVLVPRNAV